MLCCMDRVHQVMRQTLLSSHHVWAGDWQICQLHAGELDPPPIRWVAERQHAVLPRRDALEPRSMCLCLATDFQGLYLWLLAVGCRPVVLAEALHDLLLRVPPTLDICREHEILPSAFARALHFDGCCHLQFHVLFGRHDVKSE